MAQENRGRETRSFHVRNLCCHLLDFSRGCAEGEPSPDQDPLLELGVRGCARIFCGLRARGVGKPGQDLALCGLTAPK